MGIQRLVNVGIVCEDVEAVARFFVDLGMEVSGRTTVSGDWVDRTIGLTEVSCRVVMARTPDGQELELMQFEHPVAEGGETGAPPSKLGLRRLCFNVDDVETTVAGLRERGHELLGEIVDYEGIYRLCYARGPEGLIVMLAEETG
jgi:catechol 2,3-dioxygenase-like lactoylglutathione lyase family enzyme